MRILFLTHYFPPEVNAPATRTYEHARRWVTAGHEVHVITCVPSHPRGVAFSGYQSRWYQHEVHEGIHVHRVWTYLAANRGVVRRTLNYLSFVPSAVWRALRLSRFDVLVATSPQFFCAVAGWAAARLRQTPWVFELRDLWPDSIGAVGAVHNRTLLRLLERLELAMYRSANRVVCLTRSFEENLATRGIVASRLAFIPNGADVEDWAGIDRQAARARFGIGDNELAIGYVGTIGMAHGVSLMLDAAARLRAEHPRIRFFIAGDGAERCNIDEEIRRRGLDRVELLGLIPSRQARELVVASDLAVVILRPSPIFTTVLPSKMFEAMAAGVPIALGVAGEAQQTLERAGAGLSFPPGDAEAFAGVIRWAATAPGERRAMGAAGRAFVAREFSRNFWAARYLEVLEGLLPESACCIPPARPDILL